MSFIVSSFVEIMAIWACSEGQFGKILVCLICRTLFSEHREKSRKEAAEDRSGVPEEMSGQVTNHKCRWEACAFCRWRASYTSQKKMISSRLSRIADKQRIKVYGHEQKRASGTALCADLPPRQASRLCRKTGNTSTWAIIIPLTRAPGWVQRFSLLPKLCRK